FSNSKTSIGHI
ncbi:hypothetical protein D018_1903B, partial [Vibrio parahaemolyticus VP2007-007]